MENEATVGTNTNGTGGDQGTQDIQTPDVQTNDPANESESAEAAVERLKAELEAERAISKAEKTQRQKRWKIMRWLSGLPMLSWIR